jgi:hypothetical protein
MLYPKLPLQNLPQNLSKQEMRNPYIVIQDFFETYHLHDAINYLRKWLRSAFTRKSRLNKSQSLFLLDLQEQITRLLEAALLLKDDPSTDGKALNLTADDATLLNPALYYTPHKTVLAWDCFPRHLSRAEYANPYSVFEKCLEQLDLAGWRQLLKDLFYAATYDVNICEEVQDDDLYHTCRCLFKLLEACHLVKVREIDPGFSQEAAASAPVNPLPANTQAHVVNN